MASESAVETDNRIIPKFGHVDVAGREITAHGPVVGPVDVEGDGPQPVIAVIEDVAFVTDAVGAVVPVTFAGGISAGTPPITLGVVPGDMVVVGD